MSVYADVSSIRAEAAKLDPVKVALTLAAIVPFVLFFVLRFAWMVPAYLWTSGVHGWRQADKVLHARQPVAHRGG